MKNKYSLSLMLIALFMSSLAGQSKDHLSESNVNKDRLPKVKKDSFAEAMKEIEENRERDIAKEIFHIAHQPRSAWSFDAEIRPDIEKW